MDMQTASLQLLKPPKDLASWSFPLSQILEEYFNLLPEPCKIHYGEAALVIQNSVNAYVRRVEELYDETRYFNKKMTANSKENGAYSDKEKKQKKSLLGIGQFEIIDFDKDKGKSINLKGQHKKTFRLLHGCFAQLENYQSKVPIEVFDVQGEVIGKKYNFRCNHHMTQSGILVDEFTEKDFNFSKPAEEHRIESLKPPPNTIESRNKLDLILQSISNFHQNTDSAVEESLAASTQDEISDDDSESQYFEALNSNPLHLEQEDTMDNSTGHSEESFESEQVTEKGVNSHNTTISNDSCNTTSSDSREINSTTTNLINTENEDTLNSTNNISQESCNATSNDSKEMNSTTINLKNTENEDTLNSINNISQESCNATSNDSREMNSTTINLKNTENEDTLNSTNNISQESCNATSNDSREINSTIINLKNTENEDTLNSGNIISQKSCNATPSDSRETNATTINLINPDNEDTLNSKNQISNESCNTISNDSREINSSTISLKNAENEDTLNSSNKENDKTESERTENNSEIVQDKIKSCVEGDSNKRKRSDSNDNTEDCGRILRSKKFKASDDKESSCSDNVQLLKPIPFEDGIPNKSLKSRKEFRLPCHISLLKRKTYTRKSTKNKKKMLKITNKTETRTKSNDIKKKNDTETQGSISTTCTSDSPLSRMKEEDNEELQRLLEENSNRHLQASLHYEAVTTLTMDLLGFHPTRNKNYSSDSLSERSHSPLRLSPTSSTYNADTAASSSPDPTTTNKNKSEEHQQKSADNIGKSIKDKIQEIYEELDILTDEDQKIAKWHEEIKPRLEEAERKPPFRIHDYESRIMQKLETCDRKFNFEEIIREESPSEVARYFSATLQLASKNNLNIHPTNDRKHSIELILVE